MINDTNNSKPLLNTNSIQFCKHSWTGLRRSKNGLTGYHRAGARNGGSTSAAAEARGAHGWSGGALGAWTSQICLTSRPAASPTGCARLIVCPIWERALYRFSLSEVQIPQHCFHLIGKLFRKGLEGPIQRKGRKRIGVDCLALSPNDLSSIRWLSTNPMYYWLIFEIGSKKDNPFLIVDSIRDYSSDNRKGVR